MTEVQPHGPADDHTPAQIQPQGLADYLDALSKAEIDAVVRLVQNRSGLPAEPFYGPG